MNSVPHGRPNSATRTRTPSPIARAAGDAESSANRNSRSPRGDRDRPHRSPTSTSVEVACRHAEIPAMSRARRRRPRSSDEHVQAAPAPIPHRDEPRGARQATPRPPRWKPRSPRRHRNAWTQACARGRRHRDTGIMMETQPAILVGACLYFTLNTAQPRKGSSVPIRTIPPSKETYPPLLSCSPRVSDTDQRSEWLPADARPRPVACSGAAAPRDR